MGAEEHNASAYRRGLDGEKSKENVGRMEGKRGGRTDKERTADREERWQVEGV